MILVILSLILISANLAPLGCITIWKKYVYIADGLAHASIITIILSLILGINIIFTSFIMSCLFALFMINFRNTSDSNALIGFASSLSLALALLISSYYPEQNLLSQILFGDLIFINYVDLLVLFCIFLLNVSFNLYNFRSLLLVIINPDIAKCKGINVKFLEFTYLFLTAFIIQISLQIVGALLVTAITIVPALIAQIISSSPLQMIKRSVVISIIISICGMALSILLDLALAPLIITSGALCFVLVRICYDRQ